MVTKELLLTVSAELFRAQGYALTTTRQIAETLGIQKGSLYHHVRTKEDLLFWICSLAMSNITSQTAAAVADAAPGDELRALIKAHMVAELADADLHAVMLMELHSLSPERRSEVVELRDNYERFVYETIVKAQSQGHVREDVRARLLTLALLDMLNWAVFWFRPRGAMTAEELGDELSRLFLEGAGAR